MKFLKTLTPAITLGALTLSTLTANAQSANLLTYYNFNTLVNGKMPTFPIAASGGSGNTGATGNGTLTTTFNNVTSAGGSTVNAEGSDSAGQDISFQNGTSGANNNAYFTIQFSSLGYFGLKFSTAARLSSAKGPTKEELSYSTTGATGSFTNFVDLSSQITPSVGGYAPAPVIADLSSITALDNQASVYLRVTLSGGDPAAGTSNVRFDNLKVNALNTPAPSSLLVALTGISGIGLLVRRRKAVK